ncbi:MAG: integrase arm-type DNA-binding domain-containing protein [bacterium]|nr:integrase arm-type DNA-binding domain-containing protein [bacterium]
MADEKTGKPDEVESGEGVVNPTDNPSGEGKGKGRAIIRGIGGKLSDVKCRNAKCPPGKRRIVLSDGDHLQLLVTDTGHKRWEVQLRRDGKSRLFGLGSYSGHNGLADARRKRDELLAQIERGLDPVEVKRQQKAARIANQRTFADVALEWYEIDSQKYTQVTLLWRKRMVDRLIEVLGKLPIKKIRREDLIRAFQPLAVHPHACRKTATICQKIFKYAMLKDYRLDDPSILIKESALGIVPPMPETKHHASIIEADELGRLLADIDRYEGETGIVGRYLQLLPHFFTRPSELREALWQEFRLEGDDPLWIVPKERTKTRREHLVPLSKQAVKMLESLREFDRQVFGEFGECPFLFPSVKRGRLACVSDTGCLKALQMLRPGLTLHGFRSTATTWLHRGKICPEASTLAIEYQIGHSLPRMARFSYDKNDFLDERRLLMQAWSDFLDNLKAQAIEANMG